jgi:hypothetical protein
MGQKYLGELWDPGIYSIVGPRREDLRTRNCCQRLNSRLTTPASTTKDGRKTERWMDTEDQRRSRGTGQNERNSTTHRALCMYNHINTIYIVSHRPNSFLSIINKHPTFLLNFVSGDVPLCHARKAASLFGKLNAGRLNSHHDVRIVFYLHQLLARCREKKTDLPKTEPTRRKTLTSTEQIRDLLQGEIHSSEDLSHHLPEIDHDTERTTYKPCLTTKTMTFRQMRRLSTSPLCCSIWMVLSLTQRLRS